MFVWTCTPGFIPYLLKQSRGRGQWAQSNVNLVCWLMKKADWCSLMIKADVKDSITIMDVYG